MARLFGLLIPYLWVVLAAWRAHATCTCTGLDYGNGGSYLIDGSSSDRFTFTSIFEGLESRGSRSHPDVLLRVG